MKVILSSILGLVIGVILGWYLFFVSPQTLVHIKRMIFSEKKISTSPQKEIIGFLPYWLVGKGKSDYRNEITTLTYFGLTIGTNGHIQYLANDTEEEPGYHALKSNALHTVFTNAKKNDQILSLLVFSGDSDAIDSLISNPKTHGKNLVADVTPIMKTYGFTDLNIDIESTKIASDTARENLTIFVKTVVEEISQEDLGTITIEVTGNDFIKKQLINVKDIAFLVDYVVLMAYDFHYQGSAVTGPVAPLGGGSTEAEFDTNIALSQAYKVVPKEKLILGVPTYGYSWETLTKTPRSATLPGSGITITSKKGEAFLRACGSCSAVLDTKAQENFIVYKDGDTGTYHQLYIQDETTMQEKVNLVEKVNIAGMAIWALGYENGGILQPIASYKQDIVDMSRL